MKEKLKKYGMFLIAPLSVSIILLIIYAIKGIYPFGTMTIANADLGQSYMTFYHFLYDIVYNGKSVFYDYVLGMGSNMYGGFIVDGLLNPSTFIILLNTRENIPYMFSYVLIIKVAFIALTSYILFNKLYKNSFYNVIFSILYALSGYVLMYNTNIMWLDVVGLFPLFILAIKYMFETHKVHWYAIVLALMLIFNYNLAYMILMFIIFIIPIYIFLGIPKEQRKKATFDIILGTALGGALSAFAFLPSFIQVMSSYRMSGLQNVAGNDLRIFFKTATLIFYSLPLYGFIKWMKYYKQDKTNIKIYILSLVFMAFIPIIFEKVNLSLHSGSYQMFPFRYSFVPVMILNLGSLRFFNYYDKHKQITINKKIILLSIAYVLGIIACIVGIENAVIINRRLPAFIMMDENFYPIAISTVLFFIAINNITKIEREIIKKLLITVITIIQICMYTYAYIGVQPQYRYTADWSDDMIFTSYKIADKFNLSDTLYRIKDLTSSTTENCPLVYNIPSMSTFLHIISEDQVYNSRQLGYSNKGTKINDFGGTILSDAVYGVKYVLTTTYLSDKIYNYIDSIDGNKLYEYKNVLPIGITYDNDVTKIPEELNAFETQNYLYKNLFNKQDNVIITPDLTDVQIEETDYGYIYKINIKECSNLYVNLEKQMSKITVNNEDIIVPTANDKDNTEYPNKYNEGILDLGVYENEIVEIRFEVNEENTSEENIKLGLLNLEKYNKLFEEYNSNIKVEVEKNIIKIQGNSEKDTNLFIPINYDKGWKVINNVTQISKVYNNFIGVELKEGQNDIELQFRPYLFEIGVVISIIAMIGIIAINIIEKKHNIRNVKWILNITWIISIIAYSICVVKVYLINIIETFTK